MKKILLLVLSVIMIGTRTFAQDKAKKKETKEQKATTTDGAKLKKDGTPDKRFKENKETPAPAGPLKKDGTPDKRYKANKEGTKK